MYREFFRRTSQNQENVQGVYIVRNNPFHIGCRRWISS